MNRVEDKGLKDDHRVFNGYYYLADGKVVECRIQGVVRDLKKITGAKEIKLYNVYGGARVK